MRKSANPTRRAFNTHVSAYASALFLMPTKLHTQQPSPKAPKETIVSEKKPYKIVIKSGRVFIDGILKNVDIGITHENTLNIGENVANGNVEIDATDKIVSPGFIDLLADNNTTRPKNTYEIFERYKISDGVTTALQMHGGTAWTSSYLKELSKIKHHINYGVSAMIMDARRRFNRISQRYSHIERCLNEGSLGISHSIEYQPTEYEELVGYAKIATKHDVPFFLHLRYSSEEKELDGIKEAVKIAHETDARIHIDHLNSTGGTFHMEEALDIINQANEEGATITTCVYPYSYWATYSNSKRFRPGWQERYDLTYKDLEVVGTGEKLTAKTFNKLRKSSGVLLAVPEGTQPLKRTFDLAIKRDFCMVGSDGGIQREPRANNHPRGAGCFATALKRGKDIGIPVETMLGKMTTSQAGVVHELSDKANLKDGLPYPDITIFDPSTIEGTATVSDPNQYSEGIDTVIVNGEVAFQNNKNTFNNGNGKPIKRLTNNK